MERLEKEGAVEGHCLMVAWGLGSALGLGLLSAGSQACQAAAVGRRRWQPVELDVRWRACREPKEQNNYVTI